MDSVQRWLQRFNLVMMVILLLSLLAQWHLGDVRWTTAFVAGLLVGQQIGFRA